MDSINAANEAVQAIGGGATSAYVTVGAGGLILVVGLWKTLVATLRKMQVDKSSVMTRRDLDESLVDLISDLRKQLDSERARTKLEQERADRIAVELQESIRQAAAAQGQLEGIKSELEALKREVQHLRSIQQGGSNVS